MARFLLIHGVSHGAWCWDRLIPELVRRGHTARAVDLPGHGADATPRKAVRMSHYVSTVLDHMDAGTILVGHSFGGFPITLAAARAPERVASLVYLCALLPRRGQSFTDLRPEAINPAISDAVRVDREAGVSHPIPGKAAELYFSDCTDAEREFADARLTPQPIALMSETLTFKPPDVPRHYIRCLADKVVLPAYQAAVSSGWESTFEMVCGHAPFLSQPVALANILDTIAGNGGTGREAG
ncbi:MAG: alpha/beta fold hydrolase [Silicimonas sp.]|nr:alpha/beta fold hydrolase [Silicimonas sp.]